MSLHEEEMLLEEENVMGVKVCDDAMVKDGEEEGGHSTEGFGR